MKTPRKKCGTNVATAKPFTVFRIQGSQRIGVRIGKSRPFVTANEVIVSAAPVRIAISGEPPLIRITGEGVVRRHGGTIAIVA